MSATDNLGPQFHTVVEDIPAARGDYPMRNAGPGRRTSIYSTEHHEPVKDFHFKDAASPHVVGYIDTFHQADDGYSGNPATHIGHMAVRRDHQGQGLGRALAEHVVDQAGKAGGSVEWGYLASDQSAHLFRRLSEERPDVKQFGKF